MRSPLNVLKCGARSMSLSAEPAYCLFNAEPAYCFFNAEPAQCPFMRSPLNVPLCGARLSSLMRSPLIVVNAEPADLPVSRREDSERRCCLGAKSPRLAGLRLPGCYPIFHVFVKSVEFDIELELRSFFTKLSKQALSSLPPRLFLSLEPRSLPAVPCHAA